jgi:hypothetical protein
MNTHNIFLFLETYNPGGTNDGRTGCTTLWPTTKATKRRTNPRPPVVLVVALSSMFSLSRSTISVLVPRCRLYLLRPELPSRFDCDTTYSMAVADSYINVATQQSRKHRSQSGYFSIAPMYSALIVHRRSCYGLELVDLGQLPKRMVFGVVLLRVQKHPNRAENQLLILVLFLLQV